MNILLATISLVYASCSTDNDFSEYNGIVPPNGQPNGGAPDEMGGSTEASISGLTDFDVVFNSAALTENETVPSGNGNYIENATFDGTITITYSNSGASVEGDTDGVTQVSGADVTINAEKSYDLVLCGSSSDGSLTVTSSKAIGIHLKDVSLNNPDGAAIHIQSKVTTYVVAVDGTENTLTDGSRTSDDAKVKGAFYTKGKAVFSGKGQLNVYGKYKNGISTKKELIIRPNTNLYVTLADTIQKGSCVKCESTDAGKGLTVLGGVLNLDNPTVAGKGLSADGDLVISGGRITAICTGDGLWEEDELDVSGSAGIKCDSTFTLTAGDLWFKSTGKGGKGINGDTQLNFDGGTVHVMTTGQAYTYQYNRYTYDTNPKGIKCDGSINVTDGKIYVCATGTSEGSEGIEAKQQFNLKGGTVKIYAADDALNTGYSSESIREKTQMGYDMTGCVADQGQINITGGMLYAYSTSNDGIDSNGYINIAGGTAIAFGAGAPETSFDCDADSRFSVTGGTLFGIGGSASNKPSAQCTQCFSICSFSSSANTAYTVKAADGTEIVTVTVPRAYSNGALVVSSSKMQKGTTYTIGNTNFTTDASSFITSTVSGMGGGPGGMGGGPGFGGF